MDLLDAKINVFLDSETKAPCFTEVSPQKFIFLHLQSTFKKLHCFFTPNSYVACNLLITPDTE
uniref:Uncharacterized protein n=1 Tax=Oryza brachyantha TaxID=4533 RepID=J3MEX3_ORYBR